ncbi:hypothetical protein GP475_01430 [Corynebacterium poyangense]|uniref:Transmembrane protein n=1 Tax=Corynebacterium poyangense TaxID=2684405 RepID=A0A7H0SLL4_9CORY|nr:hypothetical protein [Corynebacterium poyangense]QNQ89439.1 hypothetical protein GP475_01430 [Corynebacterium poyangense]
MRHISAPAPLLSFTAAALAAIVWESLSEWLLPEPNLAYTSGVVSFFISLGISSLFVGLAASLPGGRWFFSTVAAVAGYILVMLVSLTWWVYHSPPDGQTAMAYAYVVVILAPVQFLLGSAVFFIVRALK